LAPGEAVSLSGSTLRAVTGSRSDVVARLATGPRFDSRTRLLLEGPIVGTLLRLATPNVLVMFVQASVGLIETYFVAKLGTDALAGVALVFPVLMLMQMMSAGAMGGGISSAIARALGAGRRADADALVLHALAIAVGFGVVFTLAVLAGGRWLYGILGGSGASLAAALTYSNVVFSGAILIWIFNSLANVIRGTGNMAVPAAVTSVGAAALIPLSPCLIFGWGPLPRLGVAGGAVAVIAYYAVGSVVLAAYLWAGRSVVRLSFEGARFRWPLFRDILRVGAVAALITVQTNLTIAIATGFVGRFGPAAIAGYGTGSRLEYLLVPLAAGSKRCIDGCLDRGAIVGRTIPKRPVVLDVEIEQLRRQYQVIGLATPTHPMFSPSAACLTHKADATPLGLPQPAQRSGRPASTSHMPELSPATGAMAPSTELPHSTRRSTNLGDVKRIAAVHVGLSWSSQAWLFEITRSRNGLFASTDCTWIASVPAFLILLLRQRTRMPARAATRWIPMPPAPWPSSVQSMSLPSMSTTPSML
jgi:hypothetical protein